MVYATLNWMYMYKAPIKHEYIYNVHYSTNCPQAGGHQLWSPGFVYIVSRRRP